MSLVMYDIVYVLCVCYLRKPPAAAILHHAEVKIIHVCIEYAYDICPYIGPYSEHFLRLAAALVP